MNQAHQIAIDRAMELVTSGKLPPQQQASPQLLIETAEKVYDFLTGYRADDPKPHPAVSGTPSEPSTAPASTPKPSKTTAPAQPDTPVEF